MNTKTSLSALVAAVTLVVSGAAMAQANPPTSTPGAGCTATANAMKGDNMGGHPSTTACADQPKAAAAAVAVPAPATAAAPAPATTNSTESVASTAPRADSSAMGAAGTKHVRKHRVARADRN